LVDQLAEIATIHLSGRRLHIPTKIRAIDFDLAAQSLRLLQCRKSLAEFMLQHECCLILHVKITAQLAGAKTLCCIGEESDAVKYVAEGHLPAGEHRSRRDGKLVVAGFALKLAPSFDLVNCGAHTAWAKRQAIRLSIPDRYKRGIRFFFGHAGDALRNKRPCLCREKKMLRLTILCVTFASDMMILSKNGKLIRIKCDDVGIIRSDTS
jgi:hypothetical protein